MSNLYIGLGGAGTDAVNAVYEKNQLNKVSCNKEQYLLIDTDCLSRKYLPDVLQKTFIGIGSKSPDQIRKEVLDSPQRECLLDWYDYYECDHPLNDGTGMVRPYGRIALISKYEEVYHRLSSALCELERGLATDELLHVIVFTGSCGGTGSAITLDILYMIRTIMMSGVIHDVEKCNNISLLVAMPQLWISIIGKDYTQYAPTLVYNLTANAVAFFTELQSAIDHSDDVSSSYKPLVPPAEWMKDESFVPFSCCCVFESNRMTKGEVSRNMAEVAYSLGRVDDSDIFWGMAKSMSVVSYHHFPEEFLNVATLLRYSALVDMDLAVDHLERQKVCYVYRPDFHVPIDVLNLYDDSIIGIKVEEQVGVDVLSFHSFSFKDYAFYQQYRSRSDGRWAYVDKRFARKIIESYLD